jgi:hypothetical protein
MNDEPWSATYSWLDASWMTGTGKSQHWLWRKLRDSATPDHGLFPPSRVMTHLMRARTMDAKPPQTIPGIQSAKRYWGTLKRSGRGRIE